MCVNDDGSGSELFLQAWAEHTGDLMGPETIWV